MTRDQIEKFALDYHVPADWVAVLLDKYYNDINRVSEVLCKPKREIASEIQKIVIE